MKRVIGVLATAFMFVLVSAGSVLAQTSTYPPPTNPTTSVAGGGGTNTGGGTAFTGGDISFGALLTIALLAIGLMALFVARKRAARLAV